MKIRFFLECALITGTLLAGSSLSQAGMSISDAPMFVTETLAPNVIISPVYNFDYNEVSMKDPPLAEYVACLGGEPVEGVTCSFADSEASGNTVALGAWAVGSVFNNYSNGWRVTPWPGACKTDGTATCKAGSTGFLYSKVTIYPGDRVLDAFYPTYERIDPIYYQYHPSFTPHESNDLREELYPEATAHINDSTVGKQRYIRSDMNFLYFNKSVADQYGYLPWPTLGSHPASAFPVYDSSTTKAYYNPLKKQQDGMDILADLSVSGPNWGYYYSAPATSSSVINANNLIGQYWLYTSGDVWRSTSYEAKKWNGVGSEAMSPADKANFANWFTYWRSAYLMTRGLVANLLSELGPQGQDILDKFRIGLYSRGVPVSVETGDVTTVTNNLAARLYNFSTDFTGWDHAATTEYFKTLEPYRENPSDPNSTVRSCRRNYEIIVTPDYTGLRHDGPTSRDSSQIVEADGDLNLDTYHAGETPNPQYYVDNNSNQWGDVGAYGWKTDLLSDPNNSDHDNTLLPGIRDPATWQHVVRYVIGPRMRGHIFPDSVADFSAADDIFQVQTADSWNQSANSVTGGSLRYTIDDLWHMVLNSRGFFYTSDNVSDTVRKLLAAFNDVLVRNVSGSAVATNTTSLQLGGKVYQATVETDWKGHFRAYSIEPVTTNGVTTLTLDYSAPVWDLAEKVSADAGRVILSYHGSTGVAFDWDNLSTEAQNLLTFNKPADLTTAADITAYGQRLVSYLRGDGTCEDGSPTAASCSYVDVAPDPDVTRTYTFRRRNIERTGNGLLPYSAANPNGRNVLGDIANSNPWYTTAPVAGYSDVDYPGYNMHRETNKTRDNVLYVGANDGMLHAVDASTGDEIFAYVPSFVHYRDTTAGLVTCTDSRNHGLHCLADSNYGDAHRFYVDGSPFAADVELAVTAGGATTSSWRTVLAGGANKGGKGYYLLDVTNVGLTAVTEVVPEGEVPSDAEKMVLWEFTHPRDLHYTFNTPVANSLGQARQIAKMNDGKWALIVGNGYPEAAGKKACLFIIYVAKPGPGAIPDADALGVDYHGTGYHKLCAGDANYSGAGVGGLDTNGLSTPTPVDTNGDGKVDVIYAGDLNGNMWRFNVTSATPANWAVDYAGAPLFVAKNDAGKRQPIIAPPEVTPHAAGPYSGQLVLFGTGKFLGDDDRANADVQTFYGVWDRGAVGFANLNRGHLIPQVLAAPATVGSQKYRKQTNRSVPTYCQTTTLDLCGTNDMGWYWDMDITGERLTGRLSLIGGTIFFNTFYPELSADGMLDPCKYGGDGWLMGLNAANGYVEEFALFNPETIEGELVPVMAGGLKVGAALGGTTFARGLDGKKIGIYSPTNMGTGAGEGVKMTKEITTSEEGKGRVSWYELLD